MTLQLQTANNVSLDAYTFSATVKEGNDSHEIQNIKGQFVVNSQAAEFNVSVYYNQVLVLQTELNNSQKLQTLTISQVIGFNVTCDSTYNITATSTETKQCNQPFLKAADDLVYTFSAANFTQLKFQLNGSLPQYETVFQLSLIRIADL